MDYAQRRRNMVESQIRTNKVTDEALIEALLEIPRERFVPEAYKGVAYVDEDLSVGEGRYLMEPMVLARLLQFAEVKASDVVLDVGCSTGYATALLARLAKRVVGVEGNAHLAATAKNTLKLLGFSNAEIVKAQMVEGAPEYGPYDVILIDGAVDGVPPSLTAQLAEGGRLVTVVRARPGLGRATLTEKIGGVVSSRELFDAATPLLPGFIAEESFVF
jgi:protein-L-isoaspartate(D-aspartate) O-methyltransferase